MENQSNELPIGCRARDQVDADKPPAPMSWPLSHIPVLRGTGSS